MCGCLLHTHNQGIFSDQESNQGPFILRDDGRPAHWATPAREVYCSLEASLSIYLTNLVARGKDVELKSDSL